MIKPVFGSPYRWASLEPLGRRESAIGLGSILRKSWPCERLAMRPILSATQTYNYALAKWLEDKLKPLSYDQYTVSDTFQFVDEIQGLKINNGELLVSYDVTSLFTNVPLDETIQILADKAFADDWFNQTTKLNLTKADLVDLLKAATKNQLFQFDRSLYEQIDGVAMGSPLGPLL